MAARGLKTAKHVMMVFNFIYGVGVLYLLPCLNAREGEVDKLCLHVHLCLLYYDILFI